MSAPMVRALLDGHKTQTRRALKRQFIDVLQLNDKSAWLGLIERQTAETKGEAAMFRCRYGLPGDELWVRETWKEAHPISFPLGRFGERRLYAGIPGPPGVDYLVAYRADGELLPIWHSEEYPWRTIAMPGDEFSLKHYPKGREAGWMPSIFMPRAASRISLRITDVRCERLQDISDADCLAEGIDLDTPFPSHPGFNCEGRVVTDWKWRYLSLWEQINGKGSSDANPFVWALTFEVIK
jgi:hypothetical protein